MRGHHHASGDTTVTYTPKADVRPAGPRSFPVDLAFGGICHFCGVTHISVIKPFPIPYRCSTCAAEQAALPPEPPPERPGPTPAQAAVIARIEKTTVRMVKLTEQSKLEMGRRDELLVKAQALGLSSRTIGAAAQLTSPGVLSALDRTRRAKAKSTKEEI